ncbi:MAG: hypothetical protein ACK58L_01455 [Planctomycetota bacterium]
MTSSLIRNSYGATPHEVFEEFFPSGIAAMDLASEARLLAVATRQGHLSLFNLVGDRIAEDLRFGRASQVVLSGNGETGAAIVNDNHLVTFDHKLKPIWDISVTGKILSVAISPFGGHIAFGTDSSRIHLVSLDRRELFKVDTRRPIEHIRFLSSRPELIFAAEFSQLCRMDLKGRDIWTIPMMNNAGDISICDREEKLFLAAFNHGVQVYDLDGSELGSFAIEGIPSRVRASAMNRRVAVTTLENRIYWLNFEGTIQWATDLSADPPEHTCVSALGDRLFIATQSGRLVQLMWP